MPSSCDAPLEPRTAIPRLWLPLLREGPTRHRDDDPSVLGILASFLGQGSRSASVESDQPGRHPRPDGSGIRFRRGEGCLGTPARSRSAHSPCGSLDRGTLSRALSRRQLVGAGLAVGTAAFLGVPMAEAAATVDVWGLDPDGGHHGCGCSACAACRAHASNKIFASAADANAGRAHPRCKCAVTQLASVESYVYDALFVDGGQRVSVDRRWQWVQAALASAPPVPPPTQPATAEAPAATAPQAGAADGAGTGTGPVAPDPRDDRGTLGAAAGARLRAAWIRRPAPGRRVLFVQLEARLPVETTIGLFRDRRPLARRQLPTVHGLQTIRVPLTSGVARGPARLNVRFRDASGSTRTATRALSVPAKQPRQR